VLVAGLVPPFPMVPLPPIDPLLLTLPLPFIELVLTKVVVVATKTISPLVMET
jgi:hypothetical protein